MPLKLVRRPRSPYWYIRGAVRGRSVEESTGLVDRRAAEDVLALRSAEIVRASVHGDSSVRTFAEAALSYMEAGGERAFLNPIIAHFGATRLAAIGQHHIDEAARKLKPGASPATVNRRIYTPIAAVLHHAAVKKWCDRPVIERPRQPRGRVRWVTHDEAERLIEAAGEALRPLVIFLFSTGARIGEALALDWRDVDLTAGQVVFQETKNGDRRGVALPARAVAALANLPHRKGAVFRVHYGIKRPRSPAKQLVGPAYADRAGAGGGQVKTAWAGMLRRAGISDFSPHDCRHTWATWHYQANRDLSALMHLGGWRSAQMVMRYAHANTGHLAAGQEKIWGKSGEPPAADSPNTLKSHA